MKYLLCSLYLLLSSLSYGQCSLDIYGLSYHGSGSNRNQENPGIGFNCGKNDTPWSLVGGYIAKNSYDKSGFLLGTEYRVTHNHGSLSYFYGGRALIATGYSDTNANKRVIFAPFFTFGLGYNKWELNVAANPAVAAFYISRKF